jgi:hypothetical protein
VQSRSNLFFNMCLFMVFVLWSSPNLTPIKYKCPIKKFYRITPAYLRNVIEWPHWVHIPCSCGQLVWWSMLPDDNFQCNILVMILIMTSISLLDCRFELHMQLDLESWCESCTLCMVYIHRLKLLQSNIVWRCVPGSRWC